MGKLIDFIGNNYGWFLTITILLLFALIGYIVDSKRDKNDLFKKTENEIDEINIENYQIQEGKSLNDLVSSSKIINPETKSVELTDSEILANQDTMVEQIEENPEEINNN